MAEYLNISQAVSLTGKSPQTIRRLIKNLLVSQDNLSGDYPNIKKVQTPSGFVYLIEKSFLSEKIKNRAYTPSNQTDNQKSDLGSQSDNQEVIQESNQMNSQESSNNEKSNDLNSQKTNQNYSLDTQEMFDFLKRQLEEKDTQINQLLERTRESNLIINNLQNKILLLETPKKQGFFARMFGKKK
jgi:hypothetical protein